ncbi:hypothetical protein EX30DRAFT_209963 [Ascodesmis nigricans]|uniref:Uncharacterized protein n=1 Tax=Ascodesmis nigricans TaxID=341454 RepID=A0A4S2MJK9_9PEZI|nr:hypothetical protein EX30DRAFT_209963 [Ascodesmis nigricans]
MSWTIPKSIPIARIAVTASRLHGDARHLYVRVCIPPYLACTIRVRHVSMVSTISSCPCIDYNQLQSSCLNCKAHASIAINSPIATAPTRRPMPSHQYHNLPPPRLTITFLPTLPSKIRNSSFCTSATKLPQPRSPTPSCNPHSGAAHNLGGGWDSCASMLSIQSASPRYDIL